MFAIHTLVGEVYAAQERFDRVMIFAKPLDVGDSVFVFHDLVGEVAGLFTEVVFSGGEDALLFIIGMVSSDQTHTGSADNADRACTAIEGIVCAPLIEVADNEHCAAGAL